ncbi:MAG: hypothetical protein JNL50_14450 [Phycisphaerae bacterium]|nr:hypothetical protein [Phycisphaerae bacterium]
MSDTPANTPVDRDAMLPRLWGFGWRGWAGLAVLVPLAWCVVLGPDLVYAAQVFVLEKFGWLFGFAIYGILPYGMGFRVGVFTPVTACWMIPLLHLVAIRRRGWWYAALVGYSWIVPPLWWAFPQIPGRYLPSWMWRIPSGTRDTLFYVGAGLSVALAAGMLGVCTKSRRLGIGVGLVLVLGVVVPAFVTNVFWYHVAIVSLQAAAFGVMLRWALRERWRVRHSHHCLACGYDLTGLVGDVCPECGKSISVPADTCPSSRPGGEPRRG